MEEIVNSSHCPLSRCELEDGFCDVQLTSDEWRDVLALVLHLADQGCVGFWKGWLALSNRFCLLAATHVFEPGCIHGARVPRFGCDSQTVVHVGSLKRRLCTSYEHGERRDGQSRALYRTDASTRVLHTAPHRCSSPSFWSSSCRR